VTAGRVTALVAAHEESDRVGETVRALCSIPRLECVVVVDDGSSDATAARASAAGATVLRSGQHRGKGGALEGALRRLPPAHVWLFADADLGESAARLEPVLAEVIEGRADLAIAVSPPQAGGGLGMVRRFAGGSIRVLAGIHVAAPLSGQRALTATALASCRPLARGFGVEAAMTIDAARGGLRVVEVPADVTHRSTGRGARGFAHRGRQGLDVLRALVPRLLELG
jgi:glucosyl-3-phosphoglycerate synthase